MTELQHDKEDSETINIRPVAKRNGLTSLVIGAGLFFVAIAMFKLLPNDLNIFAIAVTSAAIVMLLLGYLKMREPEHSLSISKEQIHYQHRNGHWQLAWQNIQRIDIPKVSLGLEQKNLTLVGIRAKNYGPILERISPRLMTHLLMEQRPLLLQVGNKDCATGNCYGEGLLEDDVFKDSDGKVYNGVQAMFANRMQRLRTGLGYDLYINSAELDRSAEEFADLLRSCQRSLLS
ncbi:DUF2982 domain-containing protein [Planctobacterium marinum]|uniref:DUF2982 domain-containing protein n=1 Tax=Planctobacterium marinum TaxID=1631968 RepID=A0AA48HJU6_9ALTE|nr:hypothetical protein MACH26_37040 [Planctobacterium marinum]